MRKNHLVYLTILTLMLGSCKQNINRNDVIGTYRRAPNDSSNEYNELLLRKDSTYTLIQSIMNLDVILDYYGIWEIKGSKIIFYNGYDFTDDLLIDSITDFNSDTLNVELDSTILKKFPNIKMSIEAKYDIKRNGENLMVIKPNYFKPDEDENKYEYLPLSIQLRDGNYYAIIYYAFQNKKIKISLNKEIPMIKKDILVKYNVNDSILSSFSESHKLKRHRLKKLSKAQIKLTKESEF